MIVIECDRQSFQHILGSLEQANLQGVQNVLHSSPSFPFSAATERWVTVEIPEASPPPYWCGGCSSGTCPSCESEILYDEPYCDEWSVHAMEPWK